MNSDSSAAASGACRASTATMPSWMRWRRSPGVVARPRGDVAVGERCHALTLDTDHAEPRAGEAGIDTEHDHAAHGRGRADGQRAPYPRWYHRPPMPELQARVVAFVERHPQVLPRRDQRGR